jgi:hypothetical protein
LQEKAKAGEIPGAKIGKCWVFVEFDLIEHTVECCRCDRSA